MTDLLRQPAVLKPYIRTMCSLLVIRIVFKTWLSILQRVSQSLNFYYPLMCIYIVFSAAAYPLNLLFVYYFNMSYIGCILAPSLSALFEFVSVSIMLCVKKYSFIFNIFAKKSQILTASASINNTPNSNLNQQKSMQNVVLSMSNSNSSINSPTNIKNAYLNSNPNSNCSSTGFSLSHCADLNNATFTSSEKFKQNDKYLIEQVLSLAGIKEYLKIALPSTIQNSFEWWIAEIGTLLCGYVKDPTIAISATVIMGLINGTCIMLWYGTQMVITMRVGKYIGAGMIKQAQRSAIAGLTISVTLSIIVGVSLAHWNDQIPYLFTYDEQIAGICSQLLYVFSLMQFFVCLYNNLNAIFRGIGYQSKAMWIVMIGFYFIALPICCFVLFYDKIGFKNDLVKGTVTIWVTLAFGNFLGVVFMAFYILCILKWDKVVIQSHMRMRNTMNCTYTTAGAKTDIDSDKQQLLAKNGRQIQRYDYGTIDTK